MPASAEKPRYQVVTIFGESKNLHFVVDSIAPEEEQPAIVYRSYNYFDTMDELLKLERG